MNTRPASTTAASVFACQTVRRLRRSKAGWIFLADCTTEPALSPSLMDMRKYTNGSKERPGAPAVLIHELRITRNSIREGSRTTATSCGWLNEHHPSITDRIRGNEFALPSTKLHFRPISQKQHSPVI